MTDKTLTTRPPLPDCMMPDGGEACAYVAWQAERIRALEAEVARAWGERNRAVAKVKGWKQQVYVADLPKLAVRSDEFGTGESETVAVPKITPERLTDLLDENARLRAALQAFVIAYDNESWPIENDIGLFVEARAALAPPTDG